MILSLVYWQYKVSFNMPPMVKLKQNSGIDAFKNQLEIKFNRSLLLPN